MQKKGAASTARSCLGGLTCRASSRSLSCLGGCTAAASKRSARARPCLGGASVAEALEESGSQLGGRTLSDAGSSRPPADAEDSGVACVILLVPTSCATLSLLHAFVTVRVDSKALVVRAPWSRIARPLLSWPLVRHTTGSAPYVPLCCRVEAGHCSPSMPIAPAALRIG